MLRKAGKPSVLVAAKSIVPVEFETARGGQSTFEFAESNWTKYNFIQAAMQQNLHLHHNPITTKA